MTMRIGVLSALILVGCVDAGDPRFPIELTALRYEFFEASAGIFPSPAITRDPNNPFIEFGMDQETAFAINPVGSNTAIYYAWGTLLSQESSDLGLAQYFTAVGLQGIFETDEFTENTDENDVRLQAIAAHQRVLDVFPGTRLDNTGDGVRFTRLATESYLAIEELGGVVLGNWELIETTDADGNVTQIAVQGGSDVVLPPSIEPAPEEDEDEQ
ncbi:MAG: hypothetical protein AAF658_02785 [Myxococcota bacterium]